MAGDVRVVFDDAAVKLDCERPGTQVDRGMSLLADGAVLSMKFRAPVYSGPPRGPRPGHPRQVQRASGTLRSSIRKFRQPDGSYLIGPTDTVGPPWSAPQLLGPLIEHGTPPHEIRSRGMWQLYNAATGQGFGRVVHHPGTRAHPFIRPAAEDLNGVRIRLS
jgi:hypothetical protein